MGSIKRNARSPRDSLYQASFMTTKPTKKQRELLNFIDGFIKGNGYSPSFREIMRALDYKSVSTVATHVDGLISRGLLAKKDNSARSLEIVKNTTTVESKTVSIKDEINKKIVELEKSGDEKNVEILRTALLILGYETTKAGEKSS